MSSLTINDTPVSSTPLLSQSRERNDVYTTPNERGIQTITGIEFRNEHSTHFFDDFVYWSLKSSWFEFSLACIFIWIILAAIFTLAFLYDQQNITPPVTDYSTLYLINIMNLTGFGLGKYSVDSTYLYLLLSTQAIVKLGLFAVVTGLLFSRFARPHSRIRFSHCCCISSSPAHDHGELMLQFKIFHERRETLMNVHCEATLAVTEEYEQTARSTSSSTSSSSVSGSSSSGGAPATGRWRGFYDLALVRSSLPNFALPWTVLHRLNSSSKFLQFYEQPHLLEKANAAIFISFSATDTVFGSTIHARHVYHAQDILFDRKFSDMIYSEGGKLIMDLSKLNATEPSSVVCPIKP